MKRSEQILAAESRFFVGREEEKALFASWLRSTNKEPILNIYGVGGIGKSMLLGQFQLIAKQFNTPFYVVDSRDFTHTPSGFLSHLHSMMDAEERRFSEGNLFQSCVALLNGLEQRRLVLAIDTFEQLDGIERWFREKFLSQLSDRVLIILSGRRKLQGGWNASPAWRQMIRYVHLPPFDLQTCSDYASLSDSFRPHQIVRLLTLTQGHPLMISMVIDLPYDQWKDGFDTVDSVALLTQLSSCWLREVLEARLRPILNAASMVRTFNHETLENILDTSIDDADFDRIISMSFIRRSQRGWYIHDMLRRILLQDLKLRKPEAYKQYWKNNIAFLHREISRSFSQENLNPLYSDLIYLLGSDITRAGYFDDRGADYYYMHMVNENDLDDVEAYIQDVKQDSDDRIREFNDPESFQRFIVEIPKRYVEKSLDMLDLPKLITLGGNVIRLLKNSRDEAVALLVLIPIHNDSLSFLESSLVSKHYFRTLSDEQRSVLLTPSEVPAGWFFYHIDLWKTSDGKGRQVYFQHCMEQFMKGGLFVVSSPIPFQQAVIRGMGAVEIPAATHDDYGFGSPSVTLELDLRGEKLKQYFDILVQKKGISVNHALLEDKYNFTAREREVVLMMLNCETIADIASSLFITEITVKKHLGRIYEKVGVKGKSELIKMLWVK